MLIPTQSNGESAGNKGTASFTTKKRVLILNAYSEGFHWTDRLMEGVHSVFDNEKNIELFVEYMDSKRCSDARYFEQLRNLYHHKYQRMPIDIIVACDDNALDFLLTYRESLFPGTPVSFCGINDFQNDRIAGHTNYTGVYESYDAASNIGFALSNHPKTTDIAIISDISPSGKALLTHFRRAESAYSNRLSFHYLVDASEQELEAQLKDLPTNTVIFWAIHLRFREGQPMTVEDSIQWISDTSKLPIYSIWDIVGMGIIGAKVTSPQYQGAQASTIALEILRGKSPDAIPIKGSPLVYKVDYEQLRKFQISRSEIPKGAILLNDPHEPWHKYGGLITGTLLLLTVLLIMLFGSLQLLKHTRQAKKELKKANIELKRAKNKAEESDRLKTAFLANLSHEVRTPLNGIMGFLDFLREKDLSQTDKEHFVDTIQQSSERMLMLMNDLLDISKIESGTTTIHEESFNLTQLMNHLMQFFEPEAQKRNIQLILANSSTPDDEPVIITDKLKLSQILSNLIKNALNHTPSGFVEVSYQKTETTLHFEVKDSGVGIPQDKQHIIFERFRRLNDSPYDGGEGIGIGLAITKAFVELLGGSIRVQSTLGNGSTFSFSIAIKDSEASRVVRAQPEKALV